jgi:hypothetical protein
LTYAPGTRVGSIGSVNIITGVPIQIANGIHTVRVTGPMSNAFSLSAATAAVIAAGAGAGETVQ